MKVCKSMHMYETNMHKYASNVQIKNIHYLHTQYLTNATLGTSLAFQMREEMRLEQIYFFVFWT